MKNNMLFSFFFLALVLPLLSQEGPPSLSSQVLLPVNIDFIPVGDAGNDPDPKTHLGSVPVPFQVGKYEITTEQYAVFLNAVASKNDPHALYDERMTTDPNVASISVTRTADGWSHYEALPGAQNLPITYVSRLSAMRFCNWYQNGQPNLSQGEEIITSCTEQGAYDITSNGKIETTVLNPKAIYHLLKEDEWIKAAYYKGNGLHAGYWEYPTGHDTAPNGGVGDVTNAANYKTYWSSLPKKGTWMITPVDTFAQTRSPYQARDMAGNVSEWVTSDDDDQLYSKIYGGSWKSSYAYISNNDLMRETAPTLHLLDQGENDIGFRLASYLPDISTVIPEKLDATQSQEVLELTKLAAANASKLATAQITTPDILGFFTLAMILLIVALVCFPAAIEGALGAAGLAQCLIPKIIILALALWSFFFLFNLFVH